MVGDVFVYLMHTLYHLRGQVAGSLKILPRFRHSG